MYNETITRLLEFMEKSGKAQIQVARETGLSGAVISQFISGTYEGDNDKIADSLEKYLVIDTEQHGRYFHNRKHLHVINICNSQRNSVCHMKESN